MEEITVVELRNNLRKYLERVYFGQLVLAVHRYEDQQVVLVRRDHYEQLERQCQMALLELEKIERQKRQKQLDATP